MSAYTLEQAAALRDAIARGAVRVRNGAEEVQYGSIAEMRALLAEMERSLAPAPASRKSYPSFSRGT
jgi:hypothetical protein